MLGAVPLSFAANAEVSNPRRCSQPGGSNVNTTSGPTKTTPRAIAIAVRRMIFPMATSLLRRSEFATTEEANLCSASHHVARFEPRLWWGFFFAAQTLEIKKSQLRADEDDAESEGQSDRQMNFSKRSAFSTAAAWGGGSRFVLGSPNCIAAETPATLVSCSPTKAPPPPWRGFPFGRFTGERRALNCIDRLSDGESRSASSSALGLAGLSACPAR